MDSVFSYKIDIINNNLLPKTGGYWAIVEETIIPESFVSNNGEFMFKIEEDDLDNIDTWLLVIPKNIDKLIDFLNENISYGEFLNKHCKKFYILKWDLQTFKVYLKDEVEIKELNDKIKYIENQTVTYYDKEIIKEIINFLKNIY